MLRLFDRHRFIRSAQPLDIRSCLVHARRNLVQDSMFLAIPTLLVVFVCSRKRVVGSC